MNEKLSDAGHPARVLIYTDGACTGNPGPGGYAALVVRDGECTEIAAGFARTTNNRMEILAVIMGLEALGEKRGPVTVISDSQYVVNAISKGWAKRWQANGWMRNAKEAAVNPDLWTRLLALCAQHDVEFQWVRGHAGHPENERCDFLSTRAARGNDLPRDEGYR